jgi:hypothetical protein
MLNLFLITKSNSDFQLGPLGIFMVDNIQQLLQDSGYLKS